MESLVRWLEQARRDLGIESLALADASGLLIAGSGAARDCEELAAVAAAQQAGYAPDRCVSRPVPVSEHGALLAASGGDVDLHPAATGCSRILAERVLH